MCDDDIFKQEVRMPRGQHPNSRANLTKKPPKLPPGRPAIGASIKEWFNQMQDWSRDDLLAVANNPKLGTSKVAAANRLLTSRERPDMSIFAGYLSGREDLNALKKKGVDTAIIKRVIVRETVTETGTTMIRREIELHDRGRIETEMLIDYTAGKPTNRTDVTSGGEKIQFMSVPQVLDDPDPPDAASPGSPILPVSVPPALPPA